MANLRTEALSEKILNQGKTILDRLFFPQQIKYQLRQVDMMNRDSLYYLERLDAFQIMETHIMDRIMQEYWQSNLDISGSFMDSSTAYGILNHFDDRYNFDFESQNRFYRASSSEREIKPHKMNFMIVRKSMQIRYFMEIGFMVILATCFQYYLN